MFYTGASHCGNKVPVVLADYKRLSSCVERNVLNLTIYNATCRLYMGRRSLCPGYMSGKQNLLLRENGSMFFQNYFCIESICIIIVCK